MQINDYIKLTGVAVGLSAGLFVSYKVYKTVSSKVYENNVTNDYKKEISVSDLSFSKSDYKTMADRIHQALNQPWDDNEKTVYETLQKLKSKNDWLMLVRTFGLRKRSRADWFSSNMTLIQYLEESMEWWELDKVKSILVKIGVNF